MTIVGNTGPTNVTFPAGFASATVISGGSFSSGNPTTQPQSPTGGTAYFNKTASPLVVTFYAAPPATPTPTPSPTPTPVPSGVTVYDPPAGTFPLFPTSIFNETIPSPSPNPSSSAWLAKIASSTGTIGLNSLQFASTEVGRSSDYMFPIYEEDLSAPGYTIHCTESWGTCPIEGKTIHLTSAMIPEDCSLESCSGGDRHIGYLANAEGMEYDLWGTTWPPNGSTLDIAWGGECDPTGTGYGNDGKVGKCYSTATGTPLTVGIIRVKDLMLAASNDGTLPYAIQAATKCSDTFITPMLGGDGTCAGGFPEGSRIKLNMTTAAVDATNNDPYCKVIMRTMVVHGLIITDTDGGQSGFSLQAESDLTYEAGGLPGPWATTFAPAAAAAGLPTPVYSGAYQIPICPGVDFSQSVFVTASNG